MRLPHHFSSSPFSIRWRLALLYTGVLGLCLLATDSLVYVALFRQMTREIDDGLQSQAQEIAETAGLLVVASPARVNMWVRFPNLDAFASPGLTVQALDTEGNVVQQSENLRDRSVPVDMAAVLMAVGGEPQFQTRTVDKTRVRVYYQRVESPRMLGDATGVLQVTRSLRDVEVALAQLRLFFIGVGSLSLVVATACGFWLARAALSPIDRLTRAARTIGESRDFRQRVDVPRIAQSARDEVTRLALTFNEMLSELQAAYEEQRQTLASQRRFVADASHELRTPLSTIRTNLELLQRAGDTISATDRDEALADALEEIERLSRLVADLLTLARVDSGLRLERRDVVRVDRLLRDVFRQARLLAMSHEHRVVAEPIEEAEVLGDPDYLKELLLIFIDNAVQYTPDGGRIQLSVERDDETVRISVADDGVGIGADDLPHLFDRFFRVDAARRRDVGSPHGTGLGLAIAHWISDEHGGQIEVRSQPGRGSTFTLCLPLHAIPAHPEPAVACHPGPSGARA
ncbi:MAG: HAMP domain-containing histidine kinase [Chloroflexi bacterium]|nr:HAMP domain-containing histidine kinase [Chloroflexota bacterium]